jgi:hypothetical protein
MKLRGFDEAPFLFNIGKEKREKRKEKGEKRKEKGEKRKEKGEKRKEKSKRRKEKGERRKEKREKRKEKSKRRKVILCLEDQFKFCFLSGSIYPSAFSCLQYFSIKS